jgi:hypothetical protein
MQYAVNKFLSSMVSQKEPRRYASACPCIYRARHENIQGVSGQFLKLSGVAGIQEEMGES